MKPDLAEVISKLATNKNQTPSKVVNDLLSETLKPQQRGNTNGNNTQ
ncbi:hypothetical protein [Vibrio maerlii]|nr:hypothetical protein [Vibrio maerlii]